MWLKYRPFGNAFSRQRRPEEEKQIWLEFQALGNHFQLQLTPLPLPLATNSSFLIRRYDLSCPEERLS
jgi:hypothetical protein